MFSKKHKKIDGYEGCSAWYSTPAGIYAREKLESEIENYLSEIFGFYALEMGALVNQHQFLDKSRVRSCFSLGNKRDQKNIALKADVSALPIDVDSIDLVLASHVLEYADNPHHVLREIDRVLVPEGHCLFISFNSLALWGGHRTGCKNNIGKSIKPYGLYRIRDWFSILGWEMLDVSYVGFRSPRLKGKSFDRLAKLEKWGGLYWPIFSNLTIIHAKKHALIMPTAKQKRPKASIMVPKNVVINPTSRSSHHCDRKEE